MDLDIEMADALDANEAEETTQLPEAYTHDIITGEEQEPGEVDESLGSPADDLQTEDKALVPHKINIRGLDTFNPDELKKYVSTCCSGVNFDKIEWIDDSSANLVYRSESAAQEALLALAAVEIADATQLAPMQSLPAKTYASKPDSILQIRVAVASDKKIVGAAARSRFYLLNPEYDPEERRRRGEFQRNRYRDRDGDYHRERRSDRRDGRRRETREYRYDDEDSAPFDVSLYDDDTESLARRAGRAPRARRSSGSSDSEAGKSYMKQNQGKELFPNRRSRGDHPRDRSLSPLRDKDFEEQVDVDSYAREAAALRNREKARSLKERMIKDNSAKELFPNRNNSSKELFPSRAGTSSGSKAQMDQIRQDTTVLASANVADHNTSGDPGTTASDFSIRGLASKRGSNQGLAIKGTGASVKELFPDRFANNSGKELFADKLEGRGRRRQKAADSFA